MNHYVVTSGQYSDYGIDGVFETELDAIKFIEQENNPYDTPQIEVWENDKRVKTLRYKSENGSLVVIKDNILPVKERVAE